MKESTEAMHTGFVGLTAAVWVLSMTIALSAAIIAYELHQLRVWAEGLLKW